MKKINKEINRKSSSGEWGAWLRQHRLLIVGSSIFLFLGGITLYKKYQMSLDINQKSGDSFGSQGTKSTQVGVFNESKSSQQTQTTHIEKSFNGNKDSKIDVSIGGNKP